MAEARSELSGDQLRARLADPKELRRIQAVCFSEAQTMGLIAGLVHHCRLTNVVAKLLEDGRVIENVSVYAVDSGDGECRIEVTTKRGELENEFVVRFTSSNKEPGKPAQR